jgi:hypothetical protein
MTDASTFHRSSTALVVQGLQNDVVTEGGAFVASGAPAHGRSKIVLAGRITIRGGVLGSDHDRRAGRGPEPTKSTTPNPGRSHRPRPARRTGPKRATGLSTSHWGQARTLIRST